MPEARSRLLKLVENRYTPEGYEQKKNEINAMSQEKLITEILKERARELALKDIAGLIYAELLDQKSKKK